MPRYASREDMLREMIQFEAGRYGKALKEEERAKKKARETEMAAFTCANTLLLLKAELRRVTDDN